MSVTPNWRRPRYQRRCLLGALVAVLGLLAGCATSRGVTATVTRIPSPTATSAATATPIPHPVTAFTCAVGSLPIGTGYTRIDCTITREGPNSVVRASYTGQGTNGPVDDPRLSAAGWVIIDQTHGDSPSGAIGEYLYFNESAWFAVGYSYPESTMDVEQGIPLRGAAPILCGQTLTGGGAEFRGVPMPRDMVATRAGSYILAPACLQDVMRFYTSALSAAGWTLVQPFYTPPGSAEGPVTAELAVVQRGSSTLSILLNGTEGTATLIQVGSAPPP